MLTRLIKFQLTVFAVVTVAAVVSVTIFYIRLPSAVGIGSYRVTANFATGGGIYDQANVTYMGVTVGRVVSVTPVAGHGVEVRMKLDSATKVPADVTATVQSVSAVGEQYVSLVSTPRSGDAVLQEGSRIPRERTTVGTDIAVLLAQANSLVSGISDSRLKDLLDELFKAFDGAGPDLARLIQAARPLVDEANAAWPQTAQLMDQVGPFLQAQIQSGPDIEVLADGLARFTGQVSAADPRIRDLLGTAPDAATAATETFDGIRPTFPMLAASLANFGRVGVIYHKSIEQLLVVFPALLGAMLTVAGGSPADEGGKLDFKLNFGSTPACQTGFLPPTAIRSPADDGIRDLPPDMYCKVAQNDPSAVRGARNYPCQEFPGKRAPTVQLCRDPRGYVPLGSNPWRGPPVPYGTPITDPRNILPPNKVPYIPPEADPDPGTPYAPGFLPPGAVPGPGPGPAPHAPLPVQAPPPDGPPPPPFTSWIPPDPYPAPQVPAAPPEPAPPEPAPAPPESMVPGQPALVPQASGYDSRTGRFVGPDGQVGVFASGASGLRPAETWLDLMQAPLPG